MNLINAKSFNENVFSLMDDAWCLIGACDKEREGLGYNAMTASWGGMGVLWNKNVFFCFIRPQRYTKGFADAAEKITLSFFDEKYRTALTLCGRKSGRDGDKISEAGLTAKTDDDILRFEEAKYTVVGRKLFAADMKEQDFIDREMMKKNYPSNDFHTVYVCEILSIEEN